MRTIAASLFTIVLLWNAAAIAGVVVEQEQVSGPAGKPSQPRKQTVMLEGRKQRSDLGGRALIIDLDKGSMIVLNLRDHSYFESAFPPSGPASRMAKSFIAQHMNYEKTGGQRTIAGYKCQEYSSESKTPNGEYSATACYSKDAPGAAEFNAFETAMLEKLKSGGIGEMEAKSIPEGIPLAIHSTTKITNLSLPSLPPEQTDYKADARRIAEHCEDERLSTLLTHQLGRNQKGGALDQQSNRLGRHHHHQGRGLMEQAE